MQLNPFSSPPLVGLDIQPHEMRLVQLRKTRKSFLVEQAAIVKMPDEVFSDGKIKNWDAVGLMLLETVQKFGLNGMAAAISLPANLVRMQHMQIPSGMSDAAIEEEIKVQLERDFPGLSESLHIDFSVVTSNESGYSDVFFVVTRQEYVSQYVSCINSTGLKVKIVDVDIYALKRIFHFASIADTSPEVSALACNVNSTASLIIFTLHEIIFHHQWDVGAGNEFISYLKSRIQIFLAAFPNKIIRRLAVYSHDQQIENMINNDDSTWGIEILNLNPFALITCKQYLNQQINAENISDFLIACGSAMREVPRW